ncbi:MAG: hypothetical protein ACYC0B_09005 [Gemmatimonadaceae bacterium]
MTQWLRRCILGTPPQLKLGVNQRLPSSHATRIVMERGLDLAGRILTVAAKYRASNPRREFSHGWVAFEVLRRAPGQQLKADEYERRLFDPSPDIIALAQQVAGQPGAYMDLKHIRCDIAKGRVDVEPPLSAEWCSMARCGDKKPSAETMLRPAG